MGKILYLSTWDFADHASKGITKKIQDQIAAFVQAGYEVDYTYIAKGYACFCENGTVRKLGKVGKGRKITANFWLWKELKKKHYRFVYNRYGLMDTFYYYLLKRLFHQQSKIIVEIPTYPYDAEQMPGFLWGILFAWDKMYRNRFGRYIYKIATYSEDKRIFGVDTIKLINGVDFNKITLRMPDEEQKNVHIIAVAGLAKWHGYDRLIRGIAKYYRDNHKRKIYLHIVGEGSEKENYEKIVSEEHLEEYILFHGYLQGDELDKMYNRCDVGAESFGAHRKNIYLSSSLKSREYAAKGLPIITSCKLDILNDSEYVHYFSADEKDIDALEVVNFYDRIYNKKDKLYVAKVIRNTAKEQCDISHTMNPVIECFEGDR